MEVGVYKCKMIESREKVVVSQVQSEIDRKRTDVVEKVTGTHYIDSFTSGGKITVFVYVNSCVSNSATSTEIRSSIRGLFSKFAAKAEGGVREDTTFPPVLWVVTHPKSPIKIFGLNRFANHRLPLSSQRPRLKISFHPLPVRLNRLFLQVQILLLT